MNFSFATNNVASKYFRCTNENQTMVAPCSSISLWHRSPMGNSQIGYVDDPMARPETLNRYIGASGTIQSPPVGHVRGPFLFIPCIKRLGGSSFSRLNRPHRLEQFVHTHIDSYLASISFQFHYEMCERMNVQWALWRMRLEKREGSEERPSYF